MTEPCAICGDETYRPEYWGRTVCEDCFGRPVLFAASCTTCEWSTTAAAKAYNRGAARQAAQRAGNNHEKMKRLSDDGDIHYDHDTDVWEMDHPDREDYLPSEVDQ
jgi:hypothetical protein